MEFYKDLLKKDKKSKPQVIIGILLIILSISWFLVNLFLDSLIISVYMFSTLFLIQGLVHIIEGNGKYIEYFFGKKFIQINSEHFTYKPGVLKDEVHFVWNDVKSLEFKTNKIKIVKLDSSTLILNYNQFGYSLTQIVKDKFTAIAAEKNISTINN